MLGHGGSSAGSYLADPTSLIPLALCCHYPVSKCPSASIVVTSTVRVKLKITIIIWWYVAITQRTLHLLLSRNFTKGAQTGVHLLFESPALTLKVLIFWKFTSYCTSKPLWSGIGEVPRRPYIPHPLPTVHQLLWLAPVRVNLKATCAYMIHCGDAAFKLTPTSTLYFVKKSWAI